MKYVSVKDISFPKEVKTFPEDHIRTLVAKLEAVGQGSHPITVRCGGGLRQYEVVDGADILLALNVMGDGMAYVTGECDTHRCAGGKFAKGTAESCSWRCGSHVCIDGKTVKSTQVSCIACQARNYPAAYHNRHLCTNGSQQPGTHSSCKACRPCHVHGCGQPAATCNKHRGAIAAKDMAPTCDNCGNSNKLLTFRTDGFTFCAGCSKPAEESIAARLGVTPEDGRVALERIAKQYPKIVKKHAEMKSNFISDKKPCRVPGCKKLISKGNFCKAHAAETCPLIDRDGDPLWMTADGTVVKISTMGDEHLTNTMAYLERTTRERLKVSIGDDSRWRERVTKRYDYLVAEAKCRDESLLCVACKDGVKETRTVTEGAKVTLTEVFCDECFAGKQRLEAKRIASTLAAQDKRFKIQVAIAMIVALITSGATAHYGTAFVQLIVKYLRAQGALK